MRTMFVSAAALVLPGCFASFDHSRAIEVERHWYGSTFRQRDGRLNYSDMMDALESEEAARPHVQRWRPYFKWALATSVASGASVGLGYGELARDGGNRTVGWTLVGVGLGLFIPAEVLDVRSCTLSRLRRCLRP